jgi:hypothetical protein
MHTGFVVEKVEPKNHVEDLSIIKLNLTEIG